MEPVWTNPVFTPCLQLSRKTILMTTQWVYPDLEQNRPFIFCQKRMEPRPQYIFTPIWKGVATLKRVSHLTKSRKPDVILEWSVTMLCQTKKLRDSWKKELEAQLERLFNGFIRKQPTNTLKNSSLLVVRKWI